MKRFDKGYFYYSFFASLRTVAVIFLLFAGNIGDEESFMLEDFLDALPFIGGGCLLLYIALVIYAALYVRTSGYALTDDDLRCQRGVLFRKRSVLPYNKIHAVNKKQGLIQRLFGIATLTVDSGSTTNAFSAEITIIEKEIVVDRLMAEIRCRQEGTPATEAAVRDSLIPESKRDNLYVFHSKLKFIYALLSLCGTLLALVVLGILAAIGLSIAAYLLRTAPDFSITEMLVGSVFLGALLLVLMSVISLIGGLVTSFVGYHDFKVFKNRDGIEINYGLFVRQTNTFKQSRIKAVKITAGPIKRLFGFCSASLEVVGYGNGNDSSTEENNSIAPGMLFPLCKASELDDAIDVILPGYRPDPITHRAKSYPAFILWTLFGVTVTLFGAFIAVLTILLLCEVPAAAIRYTAIGFFAALIISLLCITVCGYFNYRLAGLAIGDGKITLQHGIVVRTHTVIRQKDLIAIERVTTPLRKAKGIYTYTIHFFTNATTNTVTVKNLDATVAAQLEAMLRY